MKTFALLAVAACRKDGGAEVAPETKAATVASGVSSASSTLAAPPPTAAKAGNPALLAAGPAPALGCLAWSESRKAVACLSGATSSVGASEERTMTYLGITEPARKVASPIGAADAKAVNATLAQYGFATLDGPKTPLKAGTPAHFGTTTIDWSRKLTNKGGDNQAPTYETKVTASCAEGRTASIWREAIEGETSTITVRPFGTLLVVEWRADIAREGEVGQEHRAALVDGQTCKVTKN
ncbi:hypothetical protein AKJ09_01986 [Labilithrix luteola]|uniref:Uncharacterized protein n=1 Tax=Labilithrix luteola TaxID=1391654 RepID=A0A0K1PP85_9BACT|nr:hypothetical protein [Labilithrix luteola]AKU95322.1 hypothetical protein AKJ09_01986 [Labilithrix luteola]